MSIASLKDTAVERSAKVFSAIKVAAANGYECPSSKLLAERFQCSPDAIIDAFRALEANGMIDVLRRSPRIVRIVATGQRTAGNIQSPIDDLAELIANGREIPDAARKLGITKTYAYALFQRMRGRLGEQAR